MNCVTRRTSRKSHWRESDSRPHSYQECALPLSYSGDLNRQIPLYFTTKRALKCKGRDSNPRTQREQIYSLSPLTTRPPLRLPNYQLPDLAPTKPVDGIEPPTGCLQNSCSTTELHRHLRLFPKPSRTQAREDILSSRRAFVKRTNEKFFVANSAKLHCGMITVGSLEK